MNLERYEYVVSDAFLTYEFDSLGPNGKIRKGVTFTPYAIGSTLPRTRLYQISITKYWNIIEPLLLVYGIRNGSIEPFVKNNNYEAFLFKKKE